MKIFLFCFVSTIFIFFPLGSSKADCVRSSTPDGTTIECETQETATFNMSGFIENSSVTNILPQYNDNSIYATLEILGININSVEHSLNIGSPQSSVNPRIDVVISTFNNKAGNGSINLYGIDNNGNPSSLYITTLKQEKGNLRVSGEYYNKFSVENATVQGDLQFYNIDSSLTNISVKDIWLNNSNLTLERYGIVDINDIHLDRNSTLYISSSGTISSINSFQNVIFYGSDEKDISVRIKRFNSMGDLILRNGIDLTVDEMISDSKIIFLGDGDLTSGDLNVKEINLYGERATKSILEANINVINDIMVEKISITNSKLDLQANSLNVKDEMFLYDAIIKLDSDLKTENLTMERSSLNSINDVKVSDMRLLNSNATFKDVQIGNNLRVENSALRVNKLNFISLKNNGYFDVTFSPFPSSIPIGIFAEGDVNISNNTILNLIMIGSDGIKKGESIISEIIYSRNGTINYYPHSILLNNDESSILKIDYRIVKDKGTSFLVEVTRVISYCEALSEKGSGCKGSKDLKYTGESFVNDTAIILDSLVEEDIAITENISRLINGLDRSTLETIEDNLQSLKPISNDILMFENHQNANFVKDLHSKNNDTQQKFSMFSTSGELEDNILQTLVDTTFMGAYYGFSFDNNWSLGISAYKSNIKGNYYDIDNLGVMLLASYGIESDIINFDFIGSFGTNTYDRTKINFNDSIAQSTSMLNNFSFRAGINKDFSIAEVVFTPNFYYDVSYLLLSGYKERGMGYLYEIPDTKSIVSEFNAGLDVSYSLFKNKALLSAGGNVFYLSYASDNLLAKPYEAVDNYIKFDNSLYSGLGFSANVGVNYKMQDTEVNLSYTSSFYSNNAFINGFMLTIKM